MAAVAGYRTHMSLYAPMPAALSGFLEHGSRILFVDPFFNTFNQRYKSSLTGCLRIAKKKTRMPNSRFTIDTTKIIWRLRILH